MIKPVTGVPPLALPTPVIVVEPIALSDSLSAVPLSTDTDINTTNPVEILSPRR